MEAIGKGVLLAVGLSLLSGCTTFRTKRYDPSCGCMTYWEKRTLDRMLDNAEFERRNKKTDSLTKTIKRLTRKEYKRPIKPYKCPPKKKKVKSKNKFYKQKTPRLFRRAQ